MSTSDSMQRLPEAQQQDMQNLYGHHMPIEVRQALSEWIGKHDWLRLNPDSSPDLANYMLALTEQFFSELEDRANKTADFGTRVKLVDTHRFLKQHYNIDPLYPIRALRTCILGEQKIIAQYEPPPSGGQQQGLSHMAGNADPSLTIRRDLDECQRNVQAMDDKIRVKHQEVETFVIRYQELQKRSALVQQMQATGQTTDLHCAQQEVAQFEAMIKSNARELQQAWLDSIDRLKGSVQCLTTLEHQIVDIELGNWQRAQQRAGNGEPFQNRLDQIQEWCEILAELIWKHLQQVQRFEVLINTMEKITVSPSGPALCDSLTQLFGRIKLLLSALVCGTFVIEKQPPQVMKTNTRFSATVRLLVGGKLNVHMSPPQVKVSIISEAQAVVFARNEAYPSNEVSGEILNNIGAMEYHQATNQLSVSFRNMSLKKIKRAEKKGTESVMDEKFCLLFQSIVKVPEMTFAVQAQSLPVVVIVHGNQEPHAWATVTWDNAFSKPQRLPFVVPECVSWRDMAHVLSTKFHSATGRGLSESNLHFLATKAFRNPTLNRDTQDMMLSWGQFCKDQLPERTFTFWEWFYAIMKVTREHLRLLWNDGVVMGFVSRREAEEMLLTKHNGTFLLRFSDSELGGISIAWVAETEAGGKNILMVQPFTARDLNISSLADRVSDLHNILYLYPEIPKETAFGRYYSPAVATPHTKNDNGYIPPRLVTQIPLPFQQHSSLDSNPPTPQSFYGHSEPQNVYAGGSHDNGYGDPNSMLYALSNVQNSGQSLKRLRDDDYRDI
ncbi:signal transducer and activator of transcription 5A-like isoform X2 [Varroa jacobsoni]|nr:signal transducer and activator of transcription 5A-like isoform X2 [Varroa destructor]XP_022670385.1 signal transducer and activator of transcription 5A-like isoform X2 [Varroa destructor]XP_022686982.1 signal transducer and activator of transcription 5A-like isoform X2 [Varroa jacobsoni]XP_022686983.1 signal transducer and activator of transcription 5A-like isoform X2 [Varroa jacobsoni]